jgi:hypothetical protein
MAKAKQGWINMDGTDAAGRHNCQQPHILAHSGLFAPKVGATWGCKCGRVFKIENYGARLGWREIERPDPDLAALVREIEEAMPAEMLERPRDLVTYVLRHLARTGRVVLSDVPRER